MSKKYEKELLKKMNVSTPEKLSKENIVKELEDRQAKAEVVDIPKKRSFVKTALPMVASIAVIISIVALGITAPWQKSGTPDIAEQPSVLSNKEGVKIYSSYNEIYSKFNEIYNSYKNVYYEYGAVDDMVGLPEMAPSAGTGTSSDGEENRFEDNVSTKNEGFGTTNVQEEGVEEADVIKTDGEYVYVLASDYYNSKLAINDCGTNTVVSKVEFAQNFKATEMYLNGDMLVIVGSRSDSDENARGKALYDDSIYPMENYNKTVCYVYDITDKTAPKVISSFEQSGGLFTTRMIGTKLCCISTYFVNMYDENYVDYCIPETQYNGVNERIPADCISVIENTKSPTYTVITSYDVLDGEPVTEAILGDCSEVYASQNNIYTVETMFAGNAEQSQIYKFSYTETGIDYKNYAEIKGTILDQFALSEYEGKLRVAVTERTLVETTYADDTISATSTTNNILYVLDENMQVLGKTENLAEGESIKSARYMGNMAYVVTFRQTDPLFVIDLSDPANPQVKGELKITGFSQYLHPAPNGILIGVGRDGTDAGENLNSKVSLFDVSDPKNPMEISKIIVGDNRRYTYSPVEYNHKLFVSISNTEFLVPFCDDSMYIQYKIENNQLVEVMRYEVGEYVGIYGATFVGDTFYCLTYSYGDLSFNLVSFDMASGEIISVVEL